MYFLELFKAWRRGERRTAPRKARGRVYERKPDMGAKSKVIGTISAKVFRANGQVEDLGVISELRKEN